MVHEPRSIILYMSLKIQIIEFDKLLVKFIHGYYFEECAPFFFSGLKFKRKKYCNLLQEEAKSRFFCMFNQIKEKDASD